MMLERRRSLGPGGSIGPPLIIAAMAVLPQIVAAGRPPSLERSPCLAEKAIPGAKIGLAALRPEGRLFFGRDRRAAISSRGDAPFVLCLDDALASGASEPRAIGLGRGLAVMFYVDSAAISPLPVDAANWKALRRHVHEDAQQVGCLKMLARGTPLFDGPGGAIIGTVIDGSIPYGKWDFVKTASAGWAKLRVNLGFGPFELWTKDESPDWCPL
jgi:hypothetical protein